MNYLNSDLTARAHSRGKEPFDFATFARIYPHHTGNCRSLRPEESPAVMQEYREAYYLTYPRVQTIKEFAQLMDHIDASAY